MADLLQVPRARIRDVWPAVRPWLEKGAATSDGEWTAEMVVNECLAGRCQLWALVNEGVILGAGASRMERKQDGRQLIRVVCWAADPGAMGTFREHLDRLESFGRQNGCDHIIIEGRKGWARTFRDYKLARIELIKELRNVEQHA